MFENIKYKEDVITAMIKLANNQKEVKWSQLILELKELITLNYDGKSIARFKGDWKRKIKLIANACGYRLVHFNRNPWLAIDESLEKQSSCSSSSFSSSSSSTKSSYSLSEDEKKRVLSQYNAIEEKDKWILSTGTVVEDKMKTLVELSCFEHPIHSMIMDPDDLIWKEHFTAKELNEIKTFGGKPLGKLPRELQEYLDSYDKQWKTGSDLCEYAENQEHIPFAEFDKRWIRQSMIDISEMFHINSHLSLKDYSEADLLHGLWAFIYKLFRDDTIKASLGERSSVAVSMARNTNRSLKTNEKRQRKAMGTRVDMLFKCVNVELGLCEVGKHTVTTVDDKYLDDGLFKLPKTLRDMLCILINKNPDQTNSLSTIGILIMGLNMEVIRMDIPKGHSITRLSRTPMFEFPLSPTNIGVDFIPILEAIWKAKQIMVENIQLLGNRKRKASEFVISSDKASILEYSFVRSSKNI